MNTTQHNNRCPVYLHPEAATSLQAVAAIQRRTGLLVIITPKGFPALSAPSAVATESFGPRDGDAA